MTALGIETASHAATLPITGLTARRPGRLARWGLSLLARAAEASGGGLSAGPSASSSSAGGSSPHPYGDDRHPGPIDGMACCHLARPDKECPWERHKANYSCPPGDSRQYWICAQGSRLFGCGECTPAKTCWTGPFDCSIWWELTC